MGPGGAALCSAKPMMMVVVVRSGVRRLWAVLLDVAGSGVEKDSAMWPGTVLLDGGSTGVG
jgi:hypothetical protein